MKVILKMVFAGSNDDPSAKLRDSLSDGKLGIIGVDKDSVTWTNSYSKSLICDKLEESAILAAWWYINKKANTFCLFIVLLD